MPYGSVLVVDEVDTNLFIAKVMLERYELEVDTAKGGSAALEKLKEGNVYDVIFVESMMADMSSTDLVAALRTQGYTDPIVVLVENRQLAENKEFFQENFSEILQKPMQKERLDSILMKFITEKQPPEVIKIAREMALMDDEEEEEVILGADISKEIEEDFVRTQRNIHTEIADALYVGDFETAHRLAHTLKGLALVVNEPALSDISAKLEKYFGTKRTPEQETLTRFEAELRQVIEKIEQRQ